jgi:hypothetical protein
MVTDGGAVKNLDKPIEKQICTISHYPHPFIRGCLKSTQWQPQIYECNAKIEDE